ncbi:6-bladed beta-propeller [Longimicrobium sp.]|uniref:6-bladed beta-propeller n=1 Tax=Longimicrobium sp. TaxID=2029185 RepID=UPI003B3A8FAB
MAELASPEQRQAARLALTELFRTGDSVPLTLVRGVDVDSRGQVYVGDWGNPFVTVLSPEGKVVRRIGRRGEGPGEFANVSGVQVLPGDSVQVYDVQQDRLTVFGPGADSVAYTVNLAARGGSAHYLERVPGTDRLLAVYRRPFASHENGRDDDLRKDVVRVVTVGRQTVRDSLLVYPSPASLVLRAPGAVSVTSNPFGRRAIVRLGPGGRVYHAWTDTLGVRITSLDGTGAGGFTLRAQAPRVTDQDVDAAVTALGPNGARFRNSLVEAAPGSWPALRNLVVDDEGRAWLALPAPRDAAGEWLVYHPDGRFAGSAVLPAGTDVLRVAGGRVYAVHVDELDVPRLVVYRLDGLR